MQAIDLAFAGAFEQARLVRERVVTAREVVEATLQTIAANEASLNAFRTVLADQALAEAARLDASGAPSSAPLAGVPVAIKDDTDVAGAGTAWGAGMSGAPKAEDAPVVARLRRAGAIVIGKTNVPEMDLWPWTSSATHGVTRNPWDLERTPGGSSGGSAVAVAAGMCGFALGSDGGGSIRYPAALTGVFGIKPQRDRIPLGPDHHDAWNGLLALGPLTRSVRDAAAFLDATADTDGSYVETLRDEPRALTIAVSFDPPPRSFARLSAEYRQAVEATAELLGELGHRVIEAQIDYGPVMQNVTVRYAKGVAQDVAAFVDGADIERTTRRVAALGRRLSGRRLRRERAKEADIARRMNTVFEHADVVLTPVTGGPAPLLDDIAGRGALRSLLASNVTAWAGPWNCIGQPAAAVPAGLDASGLPVSVQLCGRRDDEATLLRLAAQIEHARPWASVRPPLPAGPGQDAEPNPPT